MALQITDLVSQSAFDQLKKLNEDLATLQTTYSKIGKDLAIHLTVDIKGKEDLDKFTKLIETDFKALNKATRQAEESQKKFTAELGQEVKTIKEAKKYNKELRKELENTNVETEGAAEKMKGLRDQMKKNIEFIEKNTDAYTKQKMGIGRYFEGFTKGALIMKGLELAVNAAKKAFNVLKKAIKDAAKNIIEFESANSTLQAVLGVSNKEMIDLQQNAMLLGRNTKYTAQEVTQLQTELARLGFAKEEIVAMSEAVLKFGLITGGSMADSAALAGAMIRTFGANAEETERYVSAMTIATNKSALSFGKLQVGLPLVAGAANALGWEIEDVLALYGKLADGGMSASIAATALRNILGQLAKKNGTMQNAMGGNIRTMEDFVRGLKKLKDEGISLSDAMDERLGGRRGGVALYNLTQMSDTVLELRDGLRGVTGEFNKAADVVQNNVQTSIEQMKSAWQDLTFVFSNSKGIMKDVIDWMTNAIRGLADSLRSIEQRYERIKEQSRNAAEKAIFSSVREGEESIAQRVYNAIAERTAALMKQNKALKETEARQQAVNDVQNQYQSIYRRATIHINEYNKLIAKENATAEEILKKNKGMYGDQVRKQRDENILKLQKQLEYWKQIRVNMDKVFDNARNEKLPTGEDDFDIDDYKPTKEASTLSAKVKEETAKTYEEINEMALKYAEQRLNNDIAIAEKGSQMELDLKTDLLNVKTELANIAARKEYNNTVSEIEKAVKLGNITAEEGAKFKEALNKDYEERIWDNNSKSILDYATLYVNSYNDMYAEKQNALTNSYAVESATLYANLEEQLARTDLNEKEKLRKVEEYKTMQKDLDLKYKTETEKLAEENVQTQIDALDAILGEEALSTDLRIELEKKLADLKMKYSKKSTDEYIKQLEREQSEEKKRADERSRRLEDYLEKAMAVYSEISKFASQLYQNEIDELDDKKDAEEEKYDKDVERIERLEEIGAISSEDAEARKRAAKDRTEAKNKEISRRQNELAYKQAIWEKSASAAQTAINTAVAIMKAWATDTISAPVMTALIAAAGAMQLATILATPVPKYAKGTEGHDGGPAIVGDGGRREFAMFGSQGWVTPATPTLVDLPKGTIVYPDASKVATFLPVRDENGKQVQIVNDYRKLEKKQGRTNSLMVSLIREVHNGNSNYANYKRSIW